MRQPKEGGRVGREMDGNSWKGIGEVEFDHQWKGKGGEGNEWKGIGEVEFDHQWKGKGGEGNGWEFMERHRRSGM